MGRVDVDAMLAEMSAPQLLQWMQVYRTDPWGEERADLRNASLMALLYNLLRRKGPARKVRDFMPRFTARPAQRPEQMLALLKMAASMGQRRRD